MTTEAAAERPQPDDIELLKKYPPGTGIHCQAEYERFAAARERIAYAYARELDPTSVDREFARSVAIEEWNNTAGRHFDIQKGVDPVVLLHARDKWLLIIQSQHERHCCVDNPTIGQFWTACRLFNVEVKEKS